VAEGAGEFIVRDAGEERLRGGDRFHGGYLISWHAARSCDEGEPCASMEQLQQIEGMAPPGPAFPRPKLCLRCIPRHSKKFRSSEVQ
jgi:hypothetical protein